MRHVRICHKQIIITNSGYTSILLGSAMHSTIFTNGIPITDMQTGDLVGIFSVLRIFPYRGKLINTIISANRSRPFNDNMGANHRACINLHFRTDDSKRANTYIISNFSIEINDSF